MSDDPTTMLNASSTASVSSTTGVGSEGGEDDDCGGVMDEEYNRWEDLPKKRKETLKILTKVSPPPPVYANLCKPRTWEVSSD